MNYFVILDDGTVTQVAGVITVTIISPLVADGTYRDSPPVVTGGAFAASPDIAGSQAVSGQIAGGVDPTVTIGASPNTLEIIGASSVAEDDAYTHEPLRFKFGPVPLIHFYTENAVIPATPVDADFPMALPTTNFRVVKADCFFFMDEVRGVTNVPPPGFVVASYTPP